MDLKKKLYMQGMAALLATVFAGIVLDVCFNYTSAFEQIAESVAIYAD